MGIKKPKPEIILTTPEVPCAKEWVIVALDPSLTATGFSISTVTPGQEVEWKTIGSVRPSDRGEQPWLRAQAMGRYITEEIKNAWRPGVEQSFILVYEAPTIANDYLAIASNMVRAQILQHIAVAFTQTQELMINASTLRSMYNLKAKGNNKGENKEKAYEFISRAKWPGLDSDACDAVLLGKVAEWATRILWGELGVVPEPIHVRLCDSTMQFKKVKSTGEQKENGMRGILLDPYYFHPYNAHGKVEVKVRLASDTGSTRLKPFAFPNCL